MTPLATQRASTEALRTRGGWVARQFPSQADHDKHMQRAAAMTRAILADRGINPDATIDHRDATNLDVFLAEGLSVLERFEDLLTRDENTERHEVSVAAE